MAKYFKLARRNPIREDGQGIYIPVIDVDGNRQELYIEIRTGEQALKLITAITDCVKPGIH